MVDCDSDFRIFYFAVVMFLLIMIQRLPITLLLCPGVTARLSELVRKRNDIVIRIKVTGIYCSTNVAHAEKFRGWWTASECLFVGHQVSR